MSKLEQFPFYTGFYIYRNEHTVYYNVHCTYMLYRSIELPFNFSFCNKLEKENDISFYYPIFLFSLYLILKYLINFSPQSLIPILIKIFLHNWLNYEKMFKINLFQKVLLCLPIRFQTLLRYFAKIMDEFQFFQIRSRDARG